MVRIDIWDVQRPEDAPSIECGFARGFTERYRAVLHGSSHAHMLIRQQDAPAGFPHQLTDRLPCFSDGVRLKSQESLCRYNVGKILGKGGFGRVNVVTETCTGRQYACKSIAKRLDVPNLSPQKQAAYLDNVKREVCSSVFLLSFFQESSTHRQV